MKPYLLSLLVAFFIGIMFSCDKQAPKEEGVYYTCPMHPEVKKNEPGQCPVCGMDLVKKEL